LSGSAPIVCGDRRGQPEHRSRVLGPGGSARRDRCGAGGNGRHGPRRDQSRFARCGGRLGGCRLGGRNVRRRDSHHRRHEDRRRGGCGGLGHHRGRLRGDSFRHSPGRLVDFPRRFQPLREPLGFFRRKFADLGSPIIAHLVATRGLRVSRGGIFSKVRSKADPATLPNVLCGKLRDQSIIEMIRDLADRNNQVLELLVVERRQTP